MDFDPPTNPRVLALLDDAKAHPDDDTPRLVLADWLDDHGESARAEFIRSQCRLVSENEALTPNAREKAQEQCRTLLARHGGAWLGPLWRFPQAVLGWHRGLLAVRGLSQFGPEDLRGIWPWVDTLRFVLQGKQGLVRVAALLQGARVTHLSLDLRRGLGEECLLDLLARFPGSGCLRSLSFGWPVSMTEWGQAGRESRHRIPRLSEGFLTALVARCPLGRHLTHLASSVPFSPEQAQLLRGLGVEPVHAQVPLWMHALAPASFQLSRQQSADRLRCLSTR
jgi:uncharacterized protein (TIGR02996 family)